jgi:tetratricopeptide (TPR) repeat protein
MSLGKRLRRLRTERGLTQKELAEPRYTHAYVSTIEAGRRHPSPAALEHFAAKLGIPSSELLTGTPADLPAQLEMRLQEARVDVSSGRIDEAEAAFARVEKEASAHKLTRIVAGAHHGAGLCLERKGRIEEAIERYERGEEALRGEPPTTRVDLVVGKARCLQILGDVRYSTYLLEGLLEALVREDLAEPGALLAIHGLLLSTYFEAGLYKKAAESAAEAMRLAPRVEDPFRLAVMHVNVSRVLLQRGEVAEATASLRRAEDLFGQLSLKTEIVRALIALGFVHSREGDLDSARSELTEALQLAQEVKSTFDEANAAQELSRIERLSGNVEQAKALIERSIALVGDHEEVAFVGACHRELGLCTLELDPVAAEKSFRNAIELYERAELPAEIAGTYRILGDLYSHQGDSRRSCESYRLGIMALEQTI